MAEDFIKVSVFTTGRALFALQLMRSLPEAQQFPLLLAGIDEAIAAANAARAANQQWMKQVGAPTARGKAGEYDVEIDRTIAGLDGHCSAYISGLGPDSPIAVLASEFSARWIPQGVAAITQLSFEDELEVVEELLAGISGEGEDAEKATLLGLTPYIKRLDDLVPKFKAELLKHPTQGALTWDKVRSIRALLQQELRYVICDVISTFKRQPQVLARVLRPLRDQEERLKALRQSRRKAVADVDPQSGREVNEPSEGEG